jgi:hypothetical protein
MRSYLDCKPFLTHKFTTLPERYATLIPLQEAIRWGHLVHGRLSTMWVDLQQDYMFRAHKTIKFDAAKWHRKLVNPMFVDCHNL